MKIRVQEECQRIMNAHAESAFPEECCGFMLGTEEENGARHITEVYKIENTKDENRERRYLIEPTAQLKAERYARESGLDVLGVYHSHPNHPSQAREFDRQYAMPFWSYFIISWMEGKTAQIQSWRLKDDRSQFDEEELL